MTENAAMATHEAEAVSIMRMVDAQENEDQAQLGGGEEQQQADTQQAVGIASIAVQIAASAAVTAYPCLSFDDALKGQAVSVLVPVLVKYDVSSAFMERWKEEFAAGAFFAGVIFSAYQTIQADKKKREEKEVNGEPA